MSTRQKTSPICSIRTRVLVADARLVDGLDRQDDVLLVQHLVVLEVVQERGGRGLGIARQEHGRALDPVRRALLQHADELDERHVGLARLREQDRGALHPGPHQEDQGARHRHRHVAADEQLRHVGAEEGEIDDEEGQHHREREAEGPAPTLPDHDDGQDRVDRHRAEDRDAIGVGEVARRAEDEHEHDHADEQQAVDARQVDLALVRSPR